MAYLRCWGDVQAWMTDNDIKRYNISRTNSPNDNNNVFVYNKDKSEAENLLVCERALSRNAGDLLHITGWRTEVARNGGFSANILYEGYVGASQAQQSTQGVGTIDINQLKSDIRREIQNQYEEERLKRERDEYLAEKKQFESDKNGVMGLLVNYLAPVAKQLLGVGTTSIAGVVNESPVSAPPIMAQPQSQDSELLQEEIHDSVFSEDEEDEVYKLLSRFKIVEPDYFQLLRKVVELAESGNPMYSMAKNILMKE